MMAWITVALCMFPLIGHTQAFSLGFTTTAPSHFLSEEDLGLKLLDEISCGGNLNFTSPINVKRECLHPTLGHFIKEFKKAASSCTNENGHIEQTMEELERIYSIYPVAQTECPLTMKDHQTFDSFVNATKTFMEHFNSLAKKGN